MKYYRLLDFNKEPLLSTPDQETFFKAGQHLDCLRELELAVRLRQGLSVVIGKSGTGKTTLSRQLLQQLTTEDQRIQAQLILDPQCGSVLEFLLAMTKSLGLPIDNESTEQQLKNGIKRYLEQTAEKGKITALIIDDGQNLPDFVLEILGVFLTFEANRHKLLQIIIFAGKKFDLILRHQANLTGQLTTRLSLKPLSLNETKQMISFRLSKSHHKSTAAPRFFSPSTVLLIYLLSGGCPRRIVTLCSRLIIALLVKNKQRAGVFNLLFSLRGHKQRTQPHRKRLIIILALSGFTAIILSPEIFHRPTGVNVRQSILRTTPVQAAGTKPIPQRGKTAPMPINRAGASEHRAHRVLKREETRLPIPVEPAVLGELRVHKGDTLSKMIARVYGRYTGARLALVRKANKIPGSGKLLYGTTIKFPGETKVNFQPAAHEFWLQLRVLNTLRAAVDVLKSYPANNPPIIIVPARRSAKDKAAVFMIVLEKRFKKKSAAAAILNSLPSNLRKQAVIRVNDQ
ncbi:MAG TPA: hypothetical protein ENK33_10960 [Desulfobacterales bacterium]|nr:hypothetical protein [Desulfobacterales bacterium]